MGGAGDGAAVARPVPRGWPAGRAGRSSAGTEPRASVVERRMRLENEQLKLALAEATMQLRIWRKGAERIPEVPSSTSKP